MKKLEEYEIVKAKEKIVDEEKNPVPELENPVDKFMLAISHGLPLDSACNYCGFPVAVVRDWLATGEKEQKENPFDDKPSKERLLYERYIHAESIFEGQLVKPILEAAERGSVPAAEWLLEHRRPEVFNKLPSEGPKESIIIVNDIKKGK